MGEKIEKEDIVLYVHVSREDPIPDSEDDGDDMDDRRRDPDRGETIVLYKYRKLDDLSPEDIGIMEFVERSRWLDIVGRRAARDFLNAAEWTKLKTFLETGGCEMPEHVRIARIVHVTSYDIRELDAFDYDDE